MEKLLLYYTLFTLTGIAIGLFISNFFLRNRFKVKVDLLNSNIKEKENCLKELESECSNKKEKLDKIVMDSIICKAQLLETSNSLRKKADEVYRAEEKLNDIKKRISNIKKIETKNKKLLIEVSKLKQELSHLSKDSILLDEFKRLKKIIKERDKELEAIKKKNKTEELSYFKISKDQFKQIEKKLKEYKTKSDILEKENINLNNIKGKQEINILEKINSSFFKFSNSSLTPKTLYELDSK